MAHYTEISKKLNEELDFSEVLVIERRRYMPRCKRFAVKVKSCFEPTRTIGAWVSAAQARKLAQAEFEAYNS